MKRNIRIRVPGRDTVSGIIQTPNKRVAATLLLAHGAGAGMRHHFMATLANSFASRGIATLRFQFLYMESGRKMPDRPPAAHAALEAAYNRALAYSKKFGTDLFVGGKSFGGRMASQVAANGKLPDVKGLIFFGFPLHAPGKPGTERADHLGALTIPMLFHQGTRDKLAELDLIRRVVRKLQKGRIHILDGADHGFNTLKSSRLTREAVIDEIVAESATFMAENAG